MKPNFFIIGAPKCGTTTLAYWLDQTPTVFMSKPKEPHHYSPDYRQTWATEFVPGRDDYEALFEKAGPNHLAIGEASTNYMWSDVAVPNILADIPNAKFIVCLRNPVDMARSMHGHHLFHGLDSISDLEEAWRAQGERRLGNRIPPWMPNPRKLQYAEACATGSQLERALRHIERDRLLVVFLEDMARSPRACYDRVIEFLGARPADINFESRNVTRRRRSVAIDQAVRRIQHHLAIPKHSLPARILFSMNNRLNAADGASTKISPALRKELVAYFLPEILKLESITARDLSAWKS